MATPLNMEFLQAFSPIFTFLLIFAVTYGILSYTKLFGENKNLYGIIAFALGIMTIIFTKLTDVITTMVPWLTVLVIFLVMVLVIFRLFGATEEDTAHVIRRYAGVRWTLIIVMLIIVIASVGVTFFNDRADDSGLSKENNITDGDVGGTGTKAAEATLVHPKVLGLLLILLIATMAIQLLSGNAGLIE